MKQFSPILEMEALARALRLSLGDIQHAVVHNAPESVDPDSNSSAGTTFTVQAGTCLFLAHADLIAYPLDANGLADFSLPLSAENLSTTFELTFTSNGRQTFSDAEGTFRLDGPHVLVLPPGKYEIVLTDQRSVGVGELAYSVAFRLDGYLLPDHQAANLRSCQTFILGD